jgi:micrococcal nuclease
MRKELNALCSALVVALVFATGCLLWLEAAYQGSSLRAAEVPAVGAEVAPELLVVAPTLGIQIPEFAGWYKAEYLSNYDGDTVRFNLKLGLGVVLVDQVLRLDHLDAPEIRGDTKERGLQAKLYVRDRLVEAAEVVVYIQRGEKDKYGRWVGEVYYRVGPEWYNVGTGLLESELAEKKEY